ncbi:MAG: Fic family protein [Verrucomicrobiota bacterium]
MRPPFEISDRVHRLFGRVERLLGRYEGLHSPRPLPRLRRSQRVRTVRDSLAIEGNTLSLDQATTVLEGKRVAAPARDILELRNANAVYEGLSEWNPYSIQDFRRAHRVLMKGLIDSAGRWRFGGVGIAKGDEIAHVAPPADRVNGLMKDLLKFAKDENVPMLVRAAVVHYEIEFIHPFEDGNGRIGRLWHTLLLYRYHPAFEFVPLEPFIRERQKEYYAVLGACDKAGNSTAFVEFGAAIVEEALRRFLETLRAEPTTPSHRIEIAFGHFGGREFSRKDYSSIFPTLSTSTASRDLRHGVEIGRLSKTGGKALTRYRFST